MILVIIIVVRGETMLQRTLGSGWGVLLPGLLIAGLMYADLSHAEQQAHCQRYLH